VAAVTAVASIGTAATIAAPAHASDAVSTSGMALTFDDHTFSNFTPAATPTFASVISGLQTVLPTVSLTAIGLTIGAESSFDDGVSSTTETCWNSDDNTAQEWIPQGITTTSDATGTSPNASAGRIIASWYDGCSLGDPEVDYALPHQGCTSLAAVTADREADKGVRIAIYSRATRSYYFALLVQPYINDAGHASYGAVRVHAGGIALYGNLLYVADTPHGFRVFDTRKFLSLNSSQDPDIKVDRTDKRQVGRHDGTFYAYSYHYVLPQVGRWSQTGNGSPDHTCDGTGPMKFAYASIDRSTSPPSLMAGEYCLPANESNPETVGRFARWRLSSTTSPASGLASGTPFDAYREPYNHIQGGATRGNTVYFNTSDGTSMGKLHKLTLVGGDLVWSEDRWVPAGPEDLSYDANANVIYSQTEYWDGREIYSMPAF